MLRHHLCRRVSVYTSLALTAHILLAKSSTAVTVGIGTNDDVRLEETWTRLRVQSLPNIHDVNIACALLVLVPIGRFRLEERIGALSVAHEGFTI